MADRVYPSSKPITANGTTTSTNHVGNPAFPATKAQLYNASRPVYRPQPPRRIRRSCCCVCCLWTTLIVVLIILLAAIAAAVLWVLYKPHRPTFSVSKLQISKFNLTSSSQINSQINMTLIARNPNKKIVFFYDPISVAVTAEGASVGKGYIPAFELDTKNTTVLRSTITSTDQSVDTASNDLLKSDLKNKNRLPLVIQLDTKVSVKIGGVKTKKVRVRIRCSGIKARVPAGKAAKATTANTSGSNCSVDLRIKIWKWTF